MSIMQDCYNRFDLVFEDTAEEHLERKEKESEELRIAVAKEKREVERKGICQGCKKLGYNRWTHNDEFYLCWNCYIHDLQCQAEVAVPYTRYDQSDDYIDRYDWEERWEFNE
jgi:hypothetical protein